MASGTPGANGMAGSRPAWGQPPPLVVRNANLPASRAGTVGGVSAVYGGPLRRCLDCNRACRTLPGWRFVKLYGFLSQQLRH